MIGRPQTYTLFPYTTLFRSDAKDREKLVDHALKSEGHRQITAMTALARSEPGVPVTTDELDRDAWLLDRKSTRLNSSHGSISYAVLCLKKKKKSKNKIEQKT